MIIRNSTGRDAQRIVSNGEQSKKRARGSRQAAFRHDMARKLRVESLEQRMMLAANIEISGTSLLLTDNVAGGSVNTVDMDYAAGTLTISDSSGLTGIGPLAAFVAGNTLTMNAGNLIGFSITDIVLDTGDGNDVVRIKGTPDGLVTTFTGLTSILTGADDDLVRIGKLASLDSIFSPLDVDGGLGIDNLSLVDYSGTPDPLITITATAVTGMAPADITYLQIETLSVDVADGLPANIAIESTSAVTEVLLDSGGDETITFGDVAGGLSGIQGAVLLTDFYGGGTDTITYDDSAYAAGRTFTLASNGSLQASGIADITVTGGVYENVVLLAGTGNDDISVTPGATSTFDIHGGDGSDTLTIDVSATTDPSLQVIPSLLGGVGEFSFTGELPVTFTEIESVQLTGNVDELAIREDLSADFADDASDDTITLTRSGALLGVNVNGIPQIDVTMASLSFVTVEGSGDRDTLVVDNSGGLVDRSIDFHGNGPVTSPGDKLAIMGNPGVAIARETYLVGATQDAGTIVLDPDDSAGPGAAGDLNGDELVITFTGLEPIDTSTPAALLDVVLTAAADDVRIRDGGLLNGFDSIELVDLSATFETFRFANKTTARVSGSSGSDTFRVEYTTAAAGLGTLEVYGHLAPGVVGLADDNAYEFVTLHSTAAIVTSIYTQGGTDLVKDRSLILDGLQGTVNVVGGETPGDNDYLLLQDIGDVVPDTVTITDSDITGAAPATITYAEIEKLFFEATAGDDTINILSTAADVETFVTGDGGGDTVTVGNETADFGVTFDGSLDAVLGPLAVSGEFNGTNGNDTLNVDDSGTSALAGAATMDVDTYTFDATGVPSVASFSGPVTVLDGFAPALIRYFYDTLAPFGMNPRLEHLNVLGSMGGDDISVEVTTAVEATTIDGHAGADLMTINGDGLSAANTFAGGDDADSFVLNVTANLGDTSFVDLTSVEFAGNDPAADPAQRDQLQINDTSGATRDLVFDYLDTPGDLDINPGGGGGLGAGAEDIPIFVRTMETVVYQGTGTADTILIEGTAGDDEITVAPLAADSALVLLGGNPWDGPADPQGFADAIPGVGGGGNGPDLQLVGLAGGLPINDDAGTNRLFVYALTEGGLNDGTASDPFGFGAGQILPDPGVGNAYDSIHVTDTTTLVNALISVNYDTSDFAQGDPDMDPAIVVNTGFESNPAATPANDVADDITLILSSSYRFQINGGDPDPLTTGIVPPDGDRLNVVSPSAEINIYSDKATPTNVSVSFGGGILPFGFSSIENLMLDANGGTVNLIGDNNNTTPQHDNFVVVGRNVDGNSADGGYQEMELVINGSDPILINNVQFLNAIGYEETDTLDITPYADNTPRGWGIDVRFDEGNPVQADGEQVDLLIYNTSLHLGVSEDIVVQPSGAEDGEVRSTNGAFGTPIVTISYINNLDIIVNDNDGDLSDTDTLTLRGTNPDATGTSGGELVEADFTAAGDLAHPLVIVTDVDPIVVAEPILYRVRDIAGFNTVTIDTMDGSDEVRVIGRDDGSLSINVIDAELLVLPGTADADDTIFVAAGSSRDTGQLSVERAGVTGPTSVDFTGTRGIVADGGGGTGLDVVYVTGTDGDDQFTVYRQIPLPRMARVDTSFGPYVAIDALGSDDSVLAFYGFGGEDAFSVGALDTVQVSVQGGDHTASDHVLVYGTNSADAITVEPTGNDSAEVVVNGLASVYVGQVELLSIDGRSSDDVLTVLTGAGDNTIELTPGSTNDAGKIQVDSLLPMDFARLGAGGSILLSDSDAADSDTLVYNGTAAADAFTVGAATVFLDARIPVATTDVENYALRGMGGDDAFTVQAQQGIAILVEGDEPSGSDTLNYAADNSGGDPVVIVELDSDLPGAPFLQTIEQVGYGVVTHAGVELVNMDIEGGDLYVAGTRGDDVISVTPLSEDSAELTALHIPTTYNIDDVPAARQLVITGGGTGRGGPTGGGFADRVIYNGTDGSDLIRVDAPDREVSLDVLGFGFPAPVEASWRAITLDDGTAAFGTPGIVEAVQVLGNNGSDTIYVAPADPVGNGLYVDVNGGSPLASDALVITDLDASGDPVPLAASAFVVVGQSRVPDAGNVLVFDNAVRLPSISYENVEVVSPNVSGGDNLLILGPDMYEQNEYRQTAAYLGSGDVLNVQNLAIFPNAMEHPGVPADQDYFRVVAKTTGIMDFQVYFHMYAGLLPADGDLSVEVLDASGNVVDVAFGSEGAAGDARVRIPVVAGQTYYLHVYGADNQVVNGYDLTVTDAAPPIPYDIELLDLPVDPDYDGTANPPANNSDTGRSHFDDVTMDASPTIIVRLDDGIFLHDLPGNPDDDTPPAENVIPIPFNPSLDPASTDAGFRVAIYVEGDPQQPGVGPQTVIGYAQPGAEEGVYIFDFDDAIVAAAAVLTDGSHFISARVEMLDPADPTQHGYGARSQSLEIVVDTEVPPIDLLDMIDDGMCPFAPDNVTNDTTPGFFGYAEADSVLRFYVDIDGDGLLQIGTDYLLGESVATPIDGNNQFPLGYYEFTTPIDLNDEVLLALGLSYDGLRTIFATAEDLAGNVTAELDAAVLTIFLDTQGPQITDVYVTSDPAYDLFDPKPSEDGPSPLVYQLSIDVRDLPERVAPDFLYAALVETIAEHAGNYHLVGDANGIIPIESVQFIGDVVVDGAEATGTILLTFTDPLPDDRYTLTVSDDLVDPACNHLDGESNTDEPQEIPLFPSGDGVPGGDFVARFTIDSRPELGVWAAGNVWVDTNGNFQFDPQNQDYTNRDIVYMMGYTSDDVFAGNFALNQGDTADGFDKLAVYGRVGTQWRWLVDTDNDGVANVETVDPLAINGLPVAGNFDLANGINGDEVGVFTGTTWYFDTNHDFHLDVASALPTTMKGYPIVGDFDGDGFDDLGTWTDDIFQIDLTNGVFRGWDGVADEVFRFGYIGVRARPVAADMDMDGYDDLGLWLPDRPGALPRESGEWNFLISDGASLLDRIVVDPIKGDNMIAYSPVPFGPDMFAQFGDDYALPIVGNFDPPVTGGGSGEPVGELYTNLADPFDVNADGVVSPIDALLVINSLNNGGSRRLEGAVSAQPYLDVNMDGFVSPIDALMVINNLNSAGSGGQGEGEAEGEFSVASGDAADLLSATTPPAGELDLGGALLLSDTLHATVVVPSSSGLVTTTSSGQVKSAAVSTEYSAPVANPIGVKQLDGEEMREWAELSDVDDLLDALPLNESLNELAALIRADQQNAVDEIFRQMGDA